MYAGMIAPIYDCTMVAYHTGGIVYTHMHTNQEPISYRSIWQFCHVAHCRASGNGGNGKLKWKAKMEKLKIGSGRQKYKRNMMALS